MLLCGLKELLILLYIQGLGLALQSSLQHRKTHFVQIMISRSLGVIFKSGSRGLIVCSKSIQSTITMRILALASITALEKLSI